MEFHLENFSLCSTTVFYCIVQNTTAVLCSVQVVNFLSSCEGFFRKSPFRNFICINTGFGGHVMNIFSNCHFNDASKECFWPKKIQISCMGSKAPFWRNWKIAKMALLNPCMKFDFFFGQNHSSEALRKWQFEKIFITWPRVQQIQDLCRQKYKKGIF